MKDGYNIYSAEGNMIRTIEGDFIHIFEDRYEITKEHILMAVVPKSMMIVRGQIEKEGL